MQGLAHHEQRRAVYGTAASLKRHSAIMEGDGAVGCDSGGGHQSGVSQPGDNTNSDAVRGSGGEASPAPCYIAGVHSIGNPTRQRPERQRPERSVSPAIQEFREIRKSLSQKEAE